jgi:uncharacterized membrane protein YeaQ/YmgE (transglycosylase-associated protein family)
MKRYLIFVAVGPLLGGFWLLLTTTILSGYWSHPLTGAQVGKFLKFFFISLQYSYLFGFLPALMIGAIDDILSHLRRIPPLARMLLVGAIAFLLAGFFYGGRGPDTGPFQFVMFGLVGFIPGAVSSWLVHKFVGELPHAVAQPPTEKVAGV